MEILNELTKSRRRLERALITGRLTCPYCGVRAKPCGYSSAEIEQGNARYELVAVTCSACSEQSVFLNQMHKSFPQQSPVPEWTRRVHPRTGRFQRQFPNTPEKYQRHYAAACRTIEASPEAAAAMARRCLEELLMDQGYTQYRIVSKIKALLGEPDNRKVLPIAVRKCVDHIRTYGNFSAHSLTNKKTLQIVDVEPDEAEWCIQIIESLFEHYFERNAEIDARIAASNAKLKSADEDPAQS